jgi:hypothetical protein
MTPERPQIPGKRSLLARILFLTGILVAGCWLISRPVITSSAAARPAMCRNNLHLIGLALHNYHDVFGSFPPARVADEAGRAVLTWRTLILPYFDHIHIYRQYDVAQPWDAPPNLSLASVRINEFACPSQQAALPGAAHYVAIVGERAAWRADGTIRLEDFRDRPGNTILLIEVSWPDLHWPEPRDLDFDAMSFRINDPAGNSPGSAHETKPSWPWQTPVPYVNVLLADGSVKHLPASTAPETLKALLTIDGGEDVKVQWLDD